MVNRLHVRRYTLGEWQTNCYVVYVDPILATGADREDDAGESESERGEYAGGRCWIIDAGYAPEPMIEFVQSRGLQLEQVILTHAHVDHIAGLHAVRSVWPRVPIVVHEAEREFLTDAALNLSIVLPEAVIAPEATATLTHGQKLALDGCVFEVRHMPGHSPGGISLYQADANLVLVGDALFSGSIGRCDFPTSDQATLFNSIRTQLYTLPDETRVHCGHGPSTTIGQERLHNPFVQG